MKLSFVPKTAKMNKAARPVSSNYHYAFLFNLVDNSFKADTVFMSLSVINL